MDDASMGWDWARSEFLELAEQSDSDAIFKFLIAVSALLLSLYILIQSLTGQSIPIYTVPSPTVVGDGSPTSEPSIRLPGSSAIHCYAPATGQILGLVNPSTPAGIDRSISQSSLAQQIWSRTSFSERRRVLTCILQHVLSNKEEISRIACLDSGKTMIDASLGEILVTLEKLKWTIDHGEKALRAEKRPTNLLMLYKSNTVRYEPLGVVAALVSWNYPFHNLIGPMISSIFAGNGIVVKASESTAWSASYFTSIVRTALSTCGHDPNLVQSIVCWPQTAGHLTSHPGISHITFIGSREVAHKVAASAAKALTPCVMELGGKDAAVVLDSARGDTNRIVEILLRGTFQASGQNCIGIERIIACPAVYDTLVARLEPRIRGLRVGSGLDSREEVDSQIDMGAMISSVSFDRLEKLIEGAVRDGARLLVGGRRLQHSTYSYGHYFQPTLLVDVTPEMDIAKEECFGPICVLMRATSHSHAIELANSANFGLGASVFGALPGLFSSQGGKTMEVVNAMETGMVSINDFAAYYAVQLPFGGAGGSGYGRFAGEEGLRGLCNIKGICKDRWSWMGISTAIPPPVRYPIRDTRRGFRFTGGVVELGYASAWGKLKGLGKLLRNS